MGKAGAAAAGAAVEYAHHKPEGEHGAEGEGHAPSEEQVDDAVEEAMHEHDTSGGVGADVGNLVPHKKKHPGGDEPNKGENFQTQLQPQEEAHFESWVKSNNVPFNPSDSHSDYDMRGFWKALQSGDKRATTAVNQADHKLHFPDTWKTPYHKTFSNESIYAKGREAPRWEGNVLVDKHGNTVADERTEDEKRGHKK